MYLLTVSGDNQISLAAETDVAAQNTVPDGLDIYIVQVMTRYPRGLPLLFVLGMYGKLEYIPDGDFPVSGKIHTRIITESFRCGGKVINDPIKIVFDGTGISHMCTSLKLKQQLHFQFQGPLSLPLKNQSVARAAAHFGHYVNLFDANIKKWLDPLVGI